MHLLRSVLFLSTFLIMSACSPSPESQTIPEIQVDPQIENNKFSPKFHESETKGEPLELKTYIIPSFYNEASKLLQGISNLTQSNPSFLTIKTDSGLRKLLDLLDKGTFKELEVFPENYSKLFNEVIQEKGQIVMFFDSTITYGGFPKTHPTEFYSYQNKVYFMAKDSSHLNISEGLVGSTADPNDAYLFILNSQDPVEYYKSINQSLRSNEIK